MEIASWNIQRINQSPDKKRAVIECLKTIDADILVLTETNENIGLSEAYSCYHSSQLSDIYREGERRVSIYSKYIFLEHLETFRNDTSICLKLRTTFGDLAVYGTVIGIYGNRTKHFNQDLDEQLIDFDKIAKTNNFCICGDLNMSGYGFDYAV